MTSKRKVAGFISVYGSFKPAAFLLFNPAPTEVAGFIIISEGIPGRIKPGEEFQHGHTSAVSFYPLPLSFPEFCINLSTVITHQISVNNNNKMHSKDEAEKSIIIY
jgi:hypothetical protein